MTAPDRSARTALKPFAGEGRPHMTCGVSFERKARMLSLRRHVRLEDNRYLGAKLPGRPKLRPQRIVVGADKQIDRKLTPDLDQAPSMGAYRQRPLLTT